MNLKLFKFSVLLISKKSFIRLIKILEEYDLINSNYKIISNDMFYYTEKLTTNNISEGFIIYEKLSF
jgi:hypothetical protein